MNRSLYQISCLSILLVAVNCSAMEWTELRKSPPEIELTEKKQPSQMLPKPEERPIPQPAPEIMVTDPEPYQPGRIDLPPSSSGSVPATEQSYSSMSKTVQDALTTLSAKINRLKGRLSSNMLKKWNELNNKMKNLLQDINKQKGSSEETVRLLPQELKKTDERLRQVKNFNADLFADDLQQQIEDKIRSLVDNWLDSPSYKQAIALNRKEWTQLIIDYPHQAYSEDPVIKKFVASPEFQNAILKQIASHVQNQNILIIPDNVRYDPRIKEIMNQLSAIGFLEGKITTIESILTTPGKRDNYVPSQIKKLQADLKEYNSQLLSSYQQLRNTLKTWGNALKTTTLQKTAQEAQTLGSLAHDYQDMRSHYTDLFEQLDQFNKTLNEEIVPTL